MNKISNINERILYIIENQCDNNQKKFANLIGFAPQVVYNIVSGRKSKPSFDVLNAIISSFVDIDSEWLLTGNGSMFKRKENNIVAEPVTSNRKTKDALYEIQRVPVFNLEATMGLVPLVNGDGVDEEKVIDYISIPMMPACDGAIYAAGDSMYPLLKSGDMIAYKRIDIDRNKIFFGEMYVLAIKIDEYETMKTIKFVHPSELGNEYLKLVSHNQHHAPRDIHINEIAAIGLVRASIRIHN